MRRTAGRLSGLDTAVPSGPPCPAAAEGRGTGMKSPPVPIKQATAIAQQLQSAFGASAAEETHDGRQVFKDKVTFEKDQYRGWKLRYVGATILKPGEVAVVTGRDEKDGILIFLVTNTSSTFSLEYVVNGRTKLAPGEETPAADPGSFDSPIYAQYNPVHTPAIGETWGPTATDGRLHRGFPGFRIEALAEDAFVRVVREEVHLLLGIADAAITNGATGTVSIYSRDATSDLAGATDTTWNVSAVSRQTIVSQGSGVYLGRINGVWNIIQPFGSGFQDGLLGKAEAAIANGASGTVGIWSGAAGSEGDTTINVTAHNKWGAIKNGDWVWISNNNVAWYIVRSYDLLLCQADDPVSFDASGTFSIFGGTPGSETDTGQNVTAYNYSGDIADGEMVLIGRNGDGYYVAEKKDPSAGGLAAYGGLWSDDSSGVCYTPGTTTSKATIFNSTFPSHNTTPSAANDEITVTVTGDYEVNFTACAYSATNPLSCVMELWVNGSETGDMDVAFTLAGVHENFGITAILSLVNTDKVSVAFRTDSVTANLCFAMANLTVKLLRAT